MEEIVCCEINMSGMLENIVNSMMMNWNIFYHYISNNLISEDISNLYTKSDITLIFEKKEKRSDEEYDDMSDIDELLINEIV